MAQYGEKRQYDEFGNPVQQTGAYGIQGGTTGTTGAYPTQETHPTGTTGAYQPGTGVGGGGEQLQEHRGFGGSKGMGGAEQHPGGGFGGTGIGGEHQREHRSGGLGGTGLGGGERHREQLGGGFGGTGLGGGERLGGGLGGAGVEAGEHHREHPGTGPGGMLHRSEELRGGRKDDEPQYAPVSAAAAAVPGGRVYATGTGGEEKNLEKEEQLPGARHHRT